MPKEWLVQASFPSDTYSDIKVFAATENLSIKSAVVRLVAQAISAWKAAKS